MLRVRSTTGINLRVEPGIPVGVRNIHGLSCLRDGTGDTAANGQPDVGRQHVRMTSPKLGPFVIDEKEGAPLRSGRLRAEVDQSAHVRVRIALDSQVAQLHPDESDRVIQRHDVSRRARRRRVTWGEA